jgi:hypothetical protein
MKRAMISTMAAGVIVFAACASAQTATDGDKDQARIKLPPRIRMPEELRIPDDKGPRRWVCKGERQAAEIMVDAIYAQAHEHDGMALAKDYALAVAFVKDYRRCIENVRPQWAPLPGNVG